MSRVRIISELWFFIKARKKFIFMPVIFMLILFGLLAFIVEIPVLTPFIYALF